MRTRDLLSPLNVFAVPGLILCAAHNVQAASWFTNSPMSTARQNHTAALLQSGKVLVAGGDGLATAELYDPASGKWTPAGSMTTNRACHTATLLPDGKVLITGGVLPITGPVGQFPVCLSSAELFDPTTGTWSATGAMRTSRGEHTATLLRNGRVLVVGGRTSKGSSYVYLQNAEMYDPTTRSWSLVPGFMDSARTLHTATLLPDGAVLVVGGLTSGGVVTNAEVFNPDNGRWNAAGSLRFARFLHTATGLPNGRVLVAGGGERAGMPAPLATELYDPVAGTWTTNGLLRSAHSSHAATLLPNGTVLVSGGSSSVSAEVFNPATGKWTNASTLKTSRSQHTATLVPNGQVLVAGGSGYGLLGAILSSAELYDSADGRWTTNGWRSTPVSHAAVLLPDGQVLVAGGFSNTGDALSSASLFDVTTGKWTNTGRMTIARTDHSITLLPSGQVLVVGGLGTANSAEVYDPVSRKWTATELLKAERFSHTATLLPSGKVLITGGLARIRGTNSAELYDPATGSWTVTRSMTTGRYSHTATLLYEGKVLIAGGSGQFGVITGGGELYDPATGAWETVGPLNIPREGHTATLLPYGKVLIVGGYGIGGVTDSAELYDPGTRKWTTTGSLTVRRYAHRATLMPNGKVLIAGGTDGSFLLLSVEVYDPATGKWTATGKLAQARSSHTATLLPDGRVFVVGRFFCDEFYDPGLGFAIPWQPQIAGCVSRLNLGSSLVVTGAQFRGVSGASSGNSADSPGDYPLVQLRSLESGQTLFLNCTNWSSSSFASLPVTGFPPGHAMVTVFVNGIPSMSRILSVVPSLTAGNVTRPRSPGSSLRIEIADLLARVTSVPAGTNFAFVGVDAGGQGAAVATNSNFISYVPVNDLNDVLTYTVSDSFGSMATGKIFVSVLKALGPVLPPGAVTIGGTVATIRAFGIPGAAYALETATNVNGPWWRVATTNTSGDGTLLFTHPSATNAQGYYRTTQP